MPVNKSANGALANITTASSDLILILNGANTETGKHVPKAETQLPPEMRIPQGENKTYLAIMLDMEAPFPSFSILSPILHWIQPNFVVSGDKLVSTDPATVDYIAASPPPGSGPHQYAVFLYEQPADFDAKKVGFPNSQKVGLGKRIRFDLDAFEIKAGLGKIIACNYFKSN